MNGELIFSSEPVSPELIPDSLSFSLAYLARDVDSDVGARKPASQRIGDNGVGGDHRASVDHPADLRRRIAPFRLAVQRDGVAGLGLARPRYRHLGGRELHRQPHRRHHRRVGDLGAGDALVDGVVVAGVHDEGVTVGGLAARRRRVREVDLLLVLVPN